MAVSFYPFWGEGATFSALNNSLPSLVRTYGKEVQVVETNGPTQCSNPDEPFPSDQLNIPLSVAGQTVFFAAGGEVERGQGATGLNYWEPAWVHYAVLGSPCESNVMSDADGQAYESLGLFGVLY